MHQSNNSTASPLEMRKVSFWINQPAIEANAIRATPIANPRDINLKERQSFTSTRGSGLMSDTESVEVNDLAFMSWQFDWKTC
jgi:hypothetical protein